MTTETVSTEILGTTRREDTEYIPYPPSFVDRIMQAVQRLPVPYWLTYFVLFILHSAFFLLLSWIDGWVDLFSVNPLIFLYPMWLWGALAIMTYLDFVAVDALASFRPLLDVPDQQIEQFEYEFTTMPARGVIVGGVIWSLVYGFLVFLAYDSFFVAYEVGILGTLVSVISGFISYFVGSAIYYHSFRQLLLASRTMKMAKQFNLFHLDPVYSFSRLTSRTGIAWIVLLSLSLVTFPIQLTNIGVLLIWFLQVVLAVAAFVLPLWIVHQRLVLQKRSAIAGLNQRVESALAQLHNRVDAWEIGDIELVNEVLAALAVEREVLQKIPTWPWRAGTLTGFLSALLLPVALMIIQIVVESLMR